MKIASPTSFCFPLVQAEFSGLLDRVDGVGSAVGQRNDIGAGGLRAQDERREVGGVEWMEHAAHNAAAVGAHEGREIVGHAVPESVVGSENDQLLPPCWITALPPCSPLPNRCPRSIGNQSASRPCR